MRTFTLETLSGTQVLDFNNAPSSVQVFANDFSDINAQLVHENINGMTNIVPRYAGDNFITASIYAQSRNEMFDILNTAGLTAKQGDSSDFYNLVYNNGEETFYKTVMVGHFTVSGEYTDIVKCELSLWDVYGYWNTSEIHTNNSSIIGNVQMPMTCIVHDSPIDTTGGALAAPVPPSPLTVFNAPLYNVTFNPNAEGYTSATVLAVPQTWQQPNTQFVYTGSLTAGSKFTTYVELSGTLYTLTTNITSTAAADFIIFNPVSLTVTACTGTIDNIQHMTNITAQTSTTVEQYDGTSWSYTTVPTTSAYDNYAVNDTITTYVASADFYTLMTTNSPSWQVTPNVNIVTGSMSNPYYVLNTNNIPTNGGFGFYTYDGTNWYWNVITLNEQATANVVMVDCNTMQLIGVGSVPLWVNSTTFNTTWQQWELTGGQWVSNTPTITAPWVQLGSASNQWYGAGNGYFMNFPNLAPSYTYSQMNVFYDNPPTTDTTLSTITVNVIQAGAYGLFFTPDPVTLGSVDPSPTWLFLFNTTGAGAVTLDFINNTATGPVSTYAWFQVTPASTTLPVATLTANGLGTVSFPPSLSGVGTVQVLDTAANFNFNGQTVTIQGLGTAGITVTMQESGVYQYVV